MNNPTSSLFSVIVPTYNRADLIGKALDSVHAQTHRPIEIIVVDDGSTDETDAVVKHWCREKVGAPASTAAGGDAQSNNPRFEAANEHGDLRLRYFLQDNAGVGTARNRGFSESQGTFIQFLDSDDLLFPQRLEILARTFTETEADLIQTGFEGFDEQTGEIVQQIYGRPGEDAFELALHGFLWANTLRPAFRRELLERSGPWRTDLICFEDREYVERAVIHARRCVAIRDILASARRSGGERLSDRMRTHEGRRCRILCEEQLANAVKQGHAASAEAVRAFASRLYRLGCRSNASGWYDHGRRCAEIANRIESKRSITTKIKQCLCAIGPIGGFLYKGINSSKRLLSTHSRFTGNTEKSLLNNTIDRKHPGLD